MTTWTKITDDPASLPEDATTHVVRGLELLDLAYWNNRIDQWIGMSGNPVFGVDQWFNLPNPNTKPQAPTDEPSDTVQDYWLCSDKQIFEAGQYQGREAALDEVLELLGKEQKYSEPGMRLIDLASRIAATIEKLKGEQ